MGNGTGGKTVYVNYHSDPLRIQTPKMTMPFGMTAWPKPEDGKENVPPQKYSLELSFKDLENNDKVKSFYNMLCDLDHRILEEGMKHSKEWFKKEHKSIDVTDAVYKRTLKIHQTSQYPPMFKVNVPVKDGKLVCDFYDENRQKIDPLEHNLRGAQAMAIVQCTGIWLAGGNFGCSWKVLQMCIVPCKRTIDEFAFDLEDEPEEEPKIENTPSTPLEDKPPSPHHATRRSYQSNDMKLNDEELFRDDDDDCIPPP